MTWRSKLWMAAVLFTFVNFGGGVVAAVQGELLHANVHAGLMLLGAHLAWRLAPRRGIWRSEGSVNHALSPELTDRLMHLEQSVDAVAIEVERISEGQRFLTRLFTEHGIPRARGEGAAEPIEIKALETTPQARSY